MAAQNVQRRLQQWCKRGSRWGTQVEQGSMQGVVQDAKLGGVRVMQRRRKALERADTGESTRKGLSLAIEGFFAFLNPDGHQVVDLNFQRVELCRRSVASVPVRQRAAQDAQCRLQQLCKRGSRLGDTR